jgi:DNA-binding FadR family transcriptional regulator
VDTVLEQLQCLLASGTYKEGEKIPPEMELGAMLGVSRTAIREAVKVLSKAGLLEVQQGRGTFVARHVPSSEPLDQRLHRANLQDIFEVRRMLDVGIAELAPLRRTNDDLKKMRKFLKKRMEAQKAGDHRACVDHDIDFHQAMAQASKNQVLADMFSAFSDVLRSALYDIRQSDLGVDYKKVLAGHCTLYEAVKNRDQARAIACVHDYLDETGRNL